MPSKAETKAVKADGSLLERALAVGRNTQFKIPEQDVEAMLELCLAFLHGDVTTNQCAKTLGVSTSRWIARVVPLIRHAIANDLIEINIKKPRNLVTIAQKERADGK